MLDRMQRLRRGAVTAVGIGDGRRRARELRRAPGPNNDQNALQPGGPAARKILDLIDAVLLGRGRDRRSAWSAMTIFVALRFRERPGEDRSPVQTHGNIVLEVSWTIIPFLILAVMAVPTVADDLRPRQDPEGPQRRPRQRRRRASGSGSTSTPTRARVLHRERDAHPGRTSRVRAHAHRREQRDPLVLGARARRQEGRRARPPNTLTIEADRPGTFLGPVRRVLRSLARRTCACG